jgi:hypothetical protein
MSAESTTSVEGVTAARRSRTRKRRPGPRTTRRALSTATTVLRRDSSSGRSSHFDPNGPHRTAPDRFIGDHISSPASSLPPGAITREIAHDPHREEHDER